MEMRVAMISQAHDGEKQQRDVNPLSIEEPVQRNRLYYLDWLRVLAVLGVFVAHTGDIFDTLYWHTRQGGQGISWNALATFGAEWGMSLVFEQATQVQMNESPTWETPFFRVNSTLT